VWEDGGGGGGNQVGGEPRLVENWRVQLVPGAPAMSTAGMPASTRPLNSGCVWAGPASAKEPTAAPSRRRIEETSARVIIICAFRAVVWQQKKVRNATLARAVGQEMRKKRTSLISCLQVGASRGVVLCCDLGRSGSGTDRLDITAFRLRTCF